MAKIKSNLPVLMALHAPPLSQKVVAERAGISKVTTNDWYHGRTQNPSLRVFKRLYEAFGWTPGDIWIIDED